MPFSKQQVNLKNWLWQLKQEEWQLNSEDEFKQFGDTNNSGKTETWVEDRKAQILWGTNLTGKAETRGKKGSKIIGATPLVDSQLAVTVFCCFIFCLCICRCICTYLCVCICRCICIWTAPHVKSQPAVEDLLCCICICLFSVFATTFVFVS